MTASSRSQTEKDTSRLNLITAADPRRIDLGHAHLDFFEAQSLPGLPERQPSSLFARREEPSKSSQRAPVLYKEWAAGRRQVPGDQLSPRGRYGASMAAPLRPRPQSKQVPPSVPETAGYQVPSYSTAAPAMLRWAAVDAVLPPVFALSPGVAAAALHTLYWDLIPAKALSCSRPRTWLSELLRFAAHVHRGQSLS